MKLQKRLEELSFGVPGEYGHSGLPVINERTIEPDTLASIKKDVHEPSLVNDFPKPYS
jgi:hypothetical protein